ncbi:tetrahydroanabasine acetyltransferase-like [Castanea sativa]|uniref:tetrahydroanabasine acetyltransferase-like n=1 Tax=Castanea sativa TaxID=21020 RepID=UPI003F6532D1
MANNHNTVFSPDRTYSQFVKPAKPTSSCVLSLSSIDNDPNLEHICQTVHVYQSNVESSYDNNHDFTSSVSNQADPARVIREALSKALVYCYPLAGKLKKNSDGKLQINCTADGVPFLVATSNCDLSSLHYLDGVDVEVTRQFVYDVPSEGDSGCHPLVLQVTKFSCGGFIIGMGLSHSVCDGFGAGLSHSVLERFREVNIKFKAGGALMDFTDWRRLGSLDIDFGWKGSINIVPVPMTMIGYVDLCMFLPPSNVYILRRKMGLGYLFLFPELPWPSSKKRWML